MKYRVLKANIHWVLKDIPQDQDNEFPLPSNHVVYFPGRENSSITVADTSRSSENANPVELLLASISSSQMLSYLQLCAKQKIPVKEYHDQGEIQISENKRGGFEISKIILKPLISFNCQHSDYIRANTLRFINESISHSIIIGILKINLDIDPRLEFLL